jgi:SulP family sulfate permease
MIIIDITGIDELRILLDEVKLRGVEVAFMSIHIPVRQVFDSSGLIKELEPGCLIENRGDAITLLFQKIDHEYCKETCPYSLFHECVTVK